MAAETVIVAAYATVLTFFLLFSHRTLRRMAERLEGELDGIPQDEGGKVSWSVEGFMEASLTPAVFQAANAVVLLGCVSWFVFGAHLGLSLEGWGFRVVSVGVFLIVAFFAYATIRDVIARRRILREGQDEKS